MFDDNILGRINRAPDENTTLLSVLKIHLQDSVNLARIRLICFLILSLCKVQTVSYERLAMGFDSQSRASSGLRRIQRFFAKYTLDIDLLAKLVFSIIPKSGKVGLTLDRTNWKFGETNINILVLGVIYKGLSFPLIFSMMPKCGNSNTKERIELMERYGRLFGFDTIDFLVADREFVGHHWLDYLNFSKIRYHIRIRENFDVLLPATGNVVKASWLFSRLKMGQFDHYHKIVYINGVACYLSAGVIKSKTGAPEFQFLISYNNPSESKECYQKRWQIETMFKALKTSGFNIEKTHLTDIQRIEKLLAIVFVSFTWCYLVGIYLNEICSIKIKTHGRRAKSLFKHGLDYIANYLLNSKFKSEFSIFHFLSCT